MPPSGNNLMEDEDWQLDCGEIRQRGKRLLASAQWSDCSFLVGPGRESARAHRLILAMASPVFQAMFYGSAAGAEASAPIPIPDVKPEVFRKLLQYIYTDDIDFDSYIMAIELYFTAQKYKLKQLLGLCINYLANNLTPQNSCHIYEFAHIIENERLRFCSLLVIKKYTKLALSDSSFEDLALGSVIEIFSLDDITIDSELDLLAAAERYFRARKKAFADMSASNTPSLDTLPGSNSKTFDKNEEKEHEVKVGANGTTENLEDTPNGEDMKTEKNQESSSSATPPQHKEDDSTLSEKTFRFTVQNITNLRDKVSSPPCYIRKLPWIIDVEPYYGEEGEKQLGVHLFWYSSSISMSCVATVTVTLRTQIPNAEQYRRVFRRLFCCHENWGYASFMAWTDVLDPKRGFIKDDSIILEAHVIVEELERLAWGSKQHTRDFETDDFAVRSVLTKIRFLTLSAKELTEYKPKMSLLTDEDMLALLRNILSTETQKPMPFGFSARRDRRVPWF